MVPIGINQQLEILAKVDLSDKVSKQRFNLNYVFKVAHYFKLETGCMISAKMKGQGTACYIGEILSNKI